MVSKKYNCSFDNYEYNYNYVYNSKIQNRSKKESTYNLLTNLHTYIRIKNLNLKNIQIKSK